MGALRNKVKDQLVCLDTQRDKVTAIPLMQTLVCLWSSLHICIIITKGEKGGGYFMHTYFVIGSVGAIVSVLLTFIIYFVIYVVCVCVCVHMPVFRCAYACMFLFIEVRS